VLLFIYFLSGAAGLVYEVVWTRLLVLRFGNTAWAASVVLAGFMGGMGLGSWLAARGRGGLRLYAALEVGIAAWALLLPALLPPLGAAAAATGGGPALHALFVLPAILVPAAFMGATLPALGRAVTGRSRFGPLYAANLAGAVAGTLATALALIPRLGLRGASLCALAANLAAGVGALLIRPAASAPPAPAPAGGLPPRAGRVAAALALSGLAALALQVIWTRRLVVALGLTTYAFAAQVAAYLLAAAAGAALGTRAAARARAPERLLLLCLVAAGGAAVLMARVSEVVFPALPIDEPAGVASSWTAWVGFLFLRALLLVAPPAFLFGAAFPAASRVLREDPTAVGRAYGANSAGAAAGAFAGGFLLIPSLGVERALQAGAALAVLAALPLARPLAGLALAALAALLAALPPPPPAMARESFLAPRGGGRLLFHREGPTASVAVVEVPAGRLLYIDGFLSSGTSVHALYMRMLGHLPLLFAPEPRRALVIAFGTGSTAGSAALHGGAGLDVVELSPEVLEAAPLFAAVHGGVLDDPRTRLHVDDGRRYLEASRERWDAITLEPLLPCFPGAIALYSREFYALARERLTRGGALCQWLPAQAQSADETRSLARAFVDVFPGATVWQYMGTLLLLGFRDGCTVGTAQLRERMVRPAVAADLARLDVRDLGGLGIGLVLDAPGTRAWALGAPPVTDDRPLVEFFRIPKAPFARNLRETLARLEALRASRGAYAGGEAEGGLSILYRATFEPAQAELRQLLKEPEER